MPEIKGIDHVHIYVANRDLAESWYSRVLGLKRSNEFEVWATESGPLVIEDIDQTLHLALFKSSNIQTIAVALGTSAQGLIEWVKHLASEGINVSPVDHDLSWSIYFKDLDGNTIEITTYEYEYFKSLHH